MIIGYFALRLVLFQKLRPSFNHTVILAEGRRGIENVSGVLTELGVDLYLSARSF